MKHFAPPPRPSKAERDKLIVDRIKRDLASALIL